MPDAAFRIHRLRIEGFKAFTEAQTIDIGGHVFVFGRNGLGKSSVVEAVRWCLFGLAGRPEAEVRNVFYPVGECKVELELEGPGGRWKVQRRLRPGSGRSDLTILDPNGDPVTESKVFPNLARIGSREGTHIIFASQQSTHRRPQADITDFDKVLYSYLGIDDVPRLLDRLKGQLEEQAEIERGLAEEVEQVEESLRSKLNELGSRTEEILAAAPWPGETVPTTAETDGRIRTFVEECGGNLERADGRGVTREWLLEEAGRAIRKLSAATRDVARTQLREAQIAHKKFTSAKERFEELREKHKTAQARFKSSEHDLTNLLGGRTKQQWQSRHDELVRQGDRRGRYVVLGQQAAAYYEDFSPEECPVCDTSALPTDVLSQLQRRIGSDPSAEELDAALTRVRKRKREIGDAEVARTAAEEARASVEPRLEEARNGFETLLDDPADPTSGDRTAERLAERIRQCELEFKETGSSVAAKENTLKNLRAESRFQGYRSQEERLRRKLESDLEPARRAHREFVDVLDTLQVAHEALQQSFNNTLNGTLPKINSLMTGAYDRLTRQASFPKIVVESGADDAKRRLRIGVTSDRTPGKSFEPSEVLNGQAFNALNLVPYFVFSQFQAEALELDCLLIDDPSQSFDTSRVELLMRELATAATHAQLIVASHETDRFEPLIKKFFPSDSYRVLRVTSFAPDVGPTLERID